MNRGGAITTTLCLLALLRAVVAGNSSAEASVAVGEVVQVSLESPPLSGNASPPSVWRHTLTHPGATFLKLHFSHLALGPGDSLYIRTPDGRTVAAHIGPVDRRGFWIPSVEGESVTLELRAYGAGDNARVAIDRYGVGTGGIGSLSTCFSDEKEDVACYAGSPIAVAARAVGRLLIEQNGLFLACTGFLVSAQDHLVTNAHCIFSRQALESAEVRFDYQTSACGGTELDPSQTFLAEELLLLDPELDVAVFRIAGRPSAQYGYLPLADREPLDQEALWIPQHPGAGPKKVSVVGCHASIGGGELDIEFGHQCDTAPGSSGSPVLDTNNEVIGVHHIGACAAGGGENRAVRMTAILPLLLPSDTTLAIKRAIVFARALRRERLRLHATLRPGRSSDGIDPGAETLTVTLADALGPLYQALVPAGAFRRVGNTFVFQDPDAAAGYLTFARIRLAGDSILLEAKDRHLTLQRPVGSEVTVRISIGDDEASQTVSFSTINGMLEYETD